MNLILFDSGEIELGLDADDERAIHLLSVLKTQVGEELKAGEVEGKLGTAVYAGIVDGRLYFRDVHFETTPPDFFPIDIVIGTPRPPTARRLMKDLTTLGVRSIHFAATDLGEKSYLQSNLWKDETRKALIEGAQQTQTTRLPSVTRHTSLEKALYAVEELEKNSLKLGFDFDAPPLLTRSETNPVSVALAIGPERGWSQRERTIFQKHAWNTCGLGNRILRTETACQVAVSLCAQKWFA